MTVSFAGLRHVLHRPPRPRDEFDRRLLVPMILGSVLNPVNSSILAVALVPIGRAFGAPPAQTAWLVSALYLATSIGQPVVGRLIDLFGPRRLYLIGTGLVGVAGILGMVAPELWVLVVSRVLLGFGTCAGYPAAMSLIRGEASRTGKDSPSGVLTALAVANQTIAVIGPSLGGLLIGIGGWRATLAVNVPLSAACLVLGSLRLPKAVPGQTGATGAGRSGAATLDFAGMGLFAATLVSLLLFLMDPGAGHWYLLVVTAVAAAGLVVRELRAAVPFIDLRVLGGNLPLLATYVRSLLAAVVSYAFLYGYTQWLEDGRGLSASATGLAQVPLFAAGIAIASITGRRKEIRGKLVVGAAGQLVASVLLLALGGTSPVWLLVVVALVVGVPQGLNTLALQNAVYHQADAARVASSAGLMRTFFYLGAIVASSANGVFFARRADTTGLHHLALFMAVAAAIFLAITVTDRSLRGIGRRPDTGTGR